MEENEAKCSGGKQCLTRTPVGHYHTCAIVGNSGILLDSNCGNEIDCFDYVIRMNMAPSKNYEKDVGTKTNMAFLNFVLAKNLLGKLSDNTKREEVLESLSYLKHGVLCYVKAFTDRVKESLRALDTTLAQSNMNISVTYSMQYLPYHTTRVLRPLVPNLTFPTSGLMAYILGTTFCDVITLYGFYPFTTDMRNRTLSYHYYDHIPVDHKTRHHFNIEYEFLTSLHKNGALRLVSDICG
ncbi:PREDICTED: alpha-2,8-sialyltransferase 8B-like [Branchiostoma belcheri]|uniref:Alpha-2,8-sialyltransferase 8B-like n=1 Tax=Branchiostoma belcheri TaxID=7741 RepID=A0A6P4XVX3_BRABE|nr:PREDICTED: alpha-2,8-sialyltransferase 8B-like [Branchiostoma belcheri]